MRLATVTLFAASSIVCSSAQAADILVNGGFESGTLSPWAVANNTPTLTTTQAHSGLYSVAAFAADAIQQSFSAVPASQISQASF